MEILGFIVFVLIFFFSIGDAKKKKGNAAQKAGTRAGARQTSVANNRRARSAPAAKPEKAGAPAAARPVKLNDFKAAMNQWLEDAMDEIHSDVQPQVRAVPQPTEGESMLDDPDCEGGSMEHAHAEGHSALKDADCVGGSMAHTHTEGVSRAAHARRMAAMDAGQDGDILPEAIDARALRRAVVMAEVLGKPRAMRKI